MSDPTNKTLFVELTESLRDELLSAAVEESAKRGIEVTAESLIVEIIADFLGKKRSKAVCQVLLRLPENVRDEIAIAAEEETLKRPRGKGKRRVSSHQLIIEVLEQYLSSSK